MTGSFTAGQTAAIIGVGTLTIGTNGNYTFTPDANYNGAVPQVTYTTNTGLTSTLDLTVTAVDDPSVLTADTQTIAEDTPAIGNVLSNDSDIDNVLSVATFTIAGINATFTAGQTATIANVGTLVIAADGAYTFTPAANYNGTVPTVSYTVTDGSGTDVTSTLNISVTPVDDSFTDLSETVTTSEDTAVTGSVLDGTISVDGPVSVVNFTVGGTTVRRPVKPRPSPMSAPWCSPPTAPTPSPRPPTTTARCQASATPSPTAPALTSPRP